MEEKKVVLVTGGASGIGFGTIEYLLEQGKYNVISFSRGENNIAIAKEKLKEKADDVYKDRRLCIKGNKGILAMKMIVRKFMKK